MRWLFIPCLPSFLPYLPLPDTPAPNMSLGVPPLCITSVSRRAATRSFRRTDPPQAWLFALCLYAIAVTVGRASSPFVSVCANGAHPMRPVSLAHPPRGEASSGPRTRPAVPEPPFDMLFPTSSAHGSLPMQWLAFPSCKPHLLALYGMACQRQLQSLAPGRPLRLQSTIMIAPFVTPAADRTPRSRRSPTTGLHAETW